MVNPQRFTTEWSLVEHEGAPAQDMYLGFEAHDAVELIKVATGAVPAADDEPHFRYDRGQKDSIAISSAQHLYARAYLGNTRVSTDESFHSDLGTTNAQI